jgi:hypothetical protein
VAGAGFKPQFSRQSRLSNLSEGTDVIVLPRCPTNQSETVEEVSPVKSINIEFFGHEKPQESSSFEPKKILKK